MFDPHTHTKIACAMVPLNITYFVELFSGFHELSLVPDTR